MGAWEVTGALVIFKTVDGRLASIRTRDVDLDASRELTEQPATEPEVQAEEAGERAVRVITDADVASVAAGHGDLEPEAALEDSPAPPAPPEAREGSVEVITWSDRVDVEANVLEVAGSLVNRGASFATDTRLDVLLLDRDGVVLESRRAVIGQGALAPGAVSSFSARFPGSPGFSSIEFDIRSRGFRTAPPPSPDEP